VSDIGSKLRSHWLELAWGLFAAANVAVVVLLSNWETIPFHFVWVSLTLVFGFRLWGPRTTWSVLLVVMTVTGLALLWSVTRSHQHWDELAEVPLMAAMFVAMVWHARREQTAMSQVRGSAEREHRLLERQRTFVRDASHELKTPITVARGHAELIRAAHQGERTAEDAQVVLEELERLSRIAERLLILAAAEHPGFLHPVPVGLGDFLRRTAHRWSPTAVRRWEVDVTTDGTVVVDPDRLGIALDALIENAVRHTTEGDRIVLAGRSDRQGAAIEVTDSGEGIPPGRVGTLFEPFARTDGARSRERGGTGLGLAIVKAIVESHQGTVELRSRTGAGSTFVLRLPVRADEHPGAYRRDESPAATNS
jgi:signal transduction histidine kinase